MLNIKKILLPLDLEQTNLPVAVVHEAADLIVVGSRSLAVRFGDVGYGIIRESPVPVVSI